MNGLLNVVRFAAEIAVFGFLAGALAASRTATYEAWAKAARLNWISAGFAVLTLIMAIAAISDDGAWWVFWCGFRTVLLIGLAVVADELRDRKFDQTVREWSE